jgi:hypothetical protein
MEEGAIIEPVRWQVPAARECIRELRGPDVAHLRLPGGQPFDAFVVEVEPDDGVTDLDGSHRERQADVPLPDQSDPLTVCERLHNPRV